MGTSPKLGREAWEDAMAKRPEVLGEIRVKGPEMPVWDDKELGAQIALEEGPPPWEKAGEGGSNARQFLSCPEDWVLYWINPKQLDATGWRGWQPVRAADPRVKVFVPSMISPEGHIRRGGPNGDLLGYMPRHWYDVRRREYAEMNARQTQASVERLEQLKEDFRRGVYGPNLELETARHPTHTQADLRGATD